MCEIKGTAGAEPPAVPLILLILPSPACLPSGSVGVGIDARD
jgi:hypothetical protein